MFKSKHNIFNGILSNYFDNSMRIHLKTTDLTKETQEMVETIAQLIRECWERCPHIQKNSKWKTYETINACNIMIKFSSFSSHIHTHTHTAHLGHRTDLILSLISKTWNWRLVTKVLLNSFGIFSAHVLLLINSI